MSDFDDLEQYCQRITGNEDFYPWNFRAIAGGIIMKGAVCPLYTRGPKKGRPNYRKHDRATVQEIFKPFGAK